jgi:ferredoxin
MSAAELFRVIADRDKCIASGACVLACPDVFEQDEDGIVVVLNELPPPRLRDAADAALRACPAAVIEIEPA